jgi:hypothetical protein
MKRNFPVITMAMAMAMAQPAAIKHGEFCLPPLQGIARRNRCNTRAFSASTAGKRSFLKKEAKPFAGWCARRGSANLL